MFKYKRTPFSRTSQVSKIIIQLLLYNYYTTIIIQLLYNYYYTIIILTLYFEKWVVYGLSIFLFSFFIKT